MDAYNDLFHQTQELIKTIRQAINTSQNRYQKVPEWKKSQNWNVVIKNLENILAATKDENKLAQQLIGLAKNLDDYFLGWADAKIKNQIKQYVLKIAIISFHSLNKVNPLLPISPCGLHEDGACIMGSLGKRYAYRAFFPQFSLPLPHALNFLTKPTFKKNCGKTKLFRIIGNNNSPYGSYWIEKIFPSSKKKWRADLAVLRMWNKGTHYVELNFDMHAWFGKASSQRVLKRDCILRGGGQQVWIPPSIIKKIKCHISLPQAIGW